MVDLTSPAPGNPEKLVSDFIKNIPTLEPVLGDKGIERFRLGDDWYIVIDPSDYFKTKKLSTNLLQTIGQTMVSRKFYLRIPKGASTNFGTISPILRMFISKVDPVLTLGSIAHDFLVGEFETAPANIKDIIYIESAEGNMVKLFDIDNDGVSSFQDIDDLKSIGQLLLQSDLVPNGVETIMRWAAAAKIFSNVAKLFAGRTAKFKRWVAWAGIIIHGLIKRKI